MASTISVDTHPESIHGDWRVTLFGDFIQRNPKDNDVEAQTEAGLVSVDNAFPQNKYDYIAVFIGADYCPHCKEFAPTVNGSVSILEQKRVKTIFVSNDRTEEAFEASCKKNAGLDVMPYNLEKTAYMRELFGLKTIPALIILRNSNFSAKDPDVVTNARNALADDPHANHFPWVKENDLAGKVKTQSMTFMERLYPSGKYGKWWELGHHANPAKPAEIYMDEHAVRIRAGILNTITWIAVINIFFWKEPIMVPILFPIVAFEFLVSANFGLGPIAPIGTVATFMASKLHPEPYWKPARPKRFAWYIGLFLATSCLTIFLLRKEMNKDLYQPLIAAVALTCNVATWLESVCGFCFGCFVYNTWLVPLMKLEECSECKL